MTYQDVMLYINGVWTQAASGETLPVLNPVDETVIGHVSRAGRRDLDLALAGAEAGFAVWSRESAFNRYKLMRKAAEILRGRAASVATILTMEEGKPLAEARGEVLAAADIIDWFAEEARRAYGRVIPARGNSTAQFTIKEPVGPVAAFTPWNFPINQVVRKLSAALAAGCSIIIKGPEETPGSPAELIRAFADAGIPAGVINLVYGVPSEISAYLIPHPVIKKISFTGSTAVGKQLAALAGLHMKRATMELGGHAPVIVLSDANLASAAAAMAAMKFYNAGQACISPTRFLIERPVYDAFLHEFTSLTKSVKVGNGLFADTEMGPLVNSKRLAAVEELVQDAVRMGAQIVTGGKRGGNSGYFFEPTVLAQVPRNARAMNEEPFGPVALILPVDDLDDAIMEANRLDYGLAAYGFTGSAESAARMAREVRAGMISINHVGLALPEVPFGGINDSGYGTEGGADALEPYFNVKFVTHMQFE